MSGEVLILVNIPNSHFLLSLTHSALDGMLRIHRYGLAWEESNQLVFDTFINLLCFGHEIQKNSVGPKINSTLNLNE